MFYDENIVLAQLLGVVKGVVVLWEIFHLFDIAYKSCFCGLFNHIMRNKILYVLFALVRADFLDLVSPKSCP